ncbi:MAG: glutathione S-transferase family protein [Betaproteobacteria bacterium]|nr:glutathione S-transferase family protein [Betaproteobacteria bacterium]
MEQLELVSFKLCPFVQRSVITLLYKDVPFKLTYIDLANRPEWFRRLSPLGKVPLLKVGERAVLFESAVINEYLDETTPPPLHPQDPLARAINRAWIEFGSACLMDLYRFTTAADAPAYEEQRQALTDKMRRLEEGVAPAPYFNGPKFSLVDAALAPLLMRLDLLNRTHQFFDPSEFPRLVAWTRALTDLEAVRDSVVPDFAPLYLDFLRTRRGHFATFLPAGT